VKAGKDTLLPWQYTILALLWVGMLVDGGALWFSFSESAGSVGQREAIRPYALGYLLATLILTPMLIVSGRRKAAEAAKEAFCSLDAFVSWRRSSWPLAWVRACSLHFTPGRGGLGRPSLCCLSPEL
jgi:hypothetical protein